MADTHVEFCGVEFKNPLVVGSSELTLNEGNMRACIDAGAGGLVAKTLTDSQVMREQTAYSKWRFLDDSHRISPGRIPHAFSFYGRSGLAEETPEEWIKELSAARRYGWERDCVVVGSIAGTTPEAWAELAGAMEECSVPLIEMNLGCPHPSELEGARTGMVVGQDPAAAAEAVEAVTEVTSIPVIVKLTPQVADMVHVVRGVREAGAAAVTLTNRFMEFAVDVEQARPYIYGWAGVGGPWVKPLTLRWVSKSYAAMPDLPIAGSNGAYGGTDVIEFMMSGATVVEMCSSIMLNGFEHISTVVREVEQFMDRNGYATASELVGIATAAAHTYEEIRALGRERAEIDRELCIDCGICEEHCYYDAIAEQGGEYVILPECRGCGICSCVCPEDAIRVILTGAAGASPDVAR